MADEDLELAIALSKSLMVRFYHTPHISAARTPPPLPNKLASALLPPPPFKHRAKRHRDPQPKRLRRQHNNHNHLRHNLPSHQQQRQPNRRRRKKGKKKRTTRQRRHGRCSNAHARAWPRASRSLCARPAERTVRCCLRSQRRSQGPPRRRGLRCPGPRLSALPRSPRKSQRCLLRTLSLPGLPQSSSTPSRASALRPCATRCGCSTSPPRPLQASRVLPVPQLQAPSRSSASLSASPSPTPSRSCARRSAPQTSPLQQRLPQYATPIMRPPHCAPSSLHRLRRHHHRLLLQQRQQALKGLHSGSERARHLEPSPKAMAAVKKQRRSTRCSAAMPHALSETCRAHAVSWVRALRS